MSATADDVLTLTLRNIEVGPVVQQRRPAPTESDPARTALRTTRDYRVTFSAESPGVSATFVVHIGWDAKGAESCPVEQLEEVGHSLVREFAARILRTSTYGSHVYPVCPTTSTLESRPVAVAGGK